MNERFSSDEPSRRGFLRGLGVSFVAGAAAGTSGFIEGTLDPDWKNLKSPDEKIKFLRTNRSGFDKDEQFRKLSALSVVGREQYGQAEYVHHAFSIFEARNMPKDIQYLLAMLAPGIPAQESRYNNEKTSRTGALYAWQLMPSAIKELNRISPPKEGARLDLKQTKDFRVGTEAAFQLFDRAIYPVVAESAKKCAEHFGLVGDDEHAKFLTLCMVNAYNAGPTRMRNILDKFASTYSAKDIHSAYDYTAPMLFNALTERAVRDNFDVGYKAESSQYAFAVLAGAESLHEQYKMSNKTTLADSLTRKSLQTKDFILEEILEPASAGIATAGAIYAADRLTQGKGLDVSRRNLIAGAVVGTIGVLGSQIPQSNIEGSSLKLWWNTEAPQKMPTETPVVFADGTQYQPESVARALTQWYENGEKKRLFGNLTPTMTQKAYQDQLARLEKYRANFTREGVPALMRTLQDEGKIHPFRNIEEVNGKLGEKFLVPVDEINTLWRTRSIGSGANSTPKNDKRFLRLTKGTESVLQTIMQKFHDKLAKAGLAPEWSVRPIVNSLLRTQDGTNKSLGSAASNDSPHAVGMGFDISNKYFDLINNKDRRFLMLGHEDIQHTTEATAYTSIVNTLNYLMASTLEEMHAKGEIALTYEPKRVHYHITSRRP